MPRKQGIPFMTSGSATITRLSVSSTRSRTSFASPDARGVEQHQDGTRLNVAGGVDQLGYFRRTLRVVQTDAFGFGEA